MEDHPSVSDPKMPRWLLLAVFCVALGVRREAVSFQQANLAADPDGYREIAERLLLRGELAEVHAFGRIPRLTTKIVHAWRPPLYPLLLAACARFTPWARSDEAELLLGIMQTVLGAATVVLVLAIAPQWGLSRSASLLAATLVLFDPILLKQSALVMTETLATLLAALGLWFLTRTGVRPSGLSATASGAALALCVLCRPTFMLWLIACGIALLMLVPSKKRLYIGLLYLAGATTILAPWTIRNWLIFHEPVVTTTHGGYTFFMANNRSYYHHLRTEGWRKPWRDKIAFVQLDELRADRLYYQLAWQNIAAEPAMFVWASAVRVMRLWDICPLALEVSEPPRAMWLRYTIACGYAIQWALAIFGVWSLGRRLLETPWIWGLLLVASFTAVHTFYWTDMRMRAPLTCVVALAAAAGVSKLLTQVVSAKPIAAPRQKTNIS